MEALNGQRREFERRRTAWTCLRVGHSWHGRSWLASDEQGLMNQQNAWADRIRWERKMPCVRACSAKERKTIRFARRMSVSLPFRFRNRSEWSKVKVRGDEKDESSLH